MHGYGWLIGMGGEYKNRDGGLGDMGQRVPALGLCCDQVPADVLILHDEGDIDVNNGFHACSS